AAGNGDRSENGDYIYGRKRLREIDRRLTYLSKVMKQAKVVEPALQQDRSRIFFGATALIIPTDDDSDDAWRRVTIVGDDESDASDGRLGWSSPLAQALRGAVVGDIREVILPSGKRDYKVLTIKYPDGSSA
ncbi:MAG: GreA/GreB family elongation factor, partial [Pseudomonadota bacterium]|nr:GreA/GreB family elongation factor [Pseudomonadota bacterium]